MDFFYRHKTLFLVLGFLLVVVLLGYLLYAVFFKPILAPAPTVKEPTATTTGQLPTADTGQAPGKATTTAAGLPIGQGETPATAAEEVATGRLTQVTALNQSPTLGLSLNNNGNDLNYYNQADNRFYRIDKDGNAVLLSDKEFFNVEKVTWSPSEENTKAILEYPDGANILYNFSNNTQVTLPTHWEDFGFDPIGDKIVAKSMGMDPDNRWLVVSNDDGSSVKPIENMGENADSVYNEWSPNNQMIAMYTEGIDFDRQEVYFVGQNDENFKSTVIPGRGFDPLWTETGDRLMYSVYTSDNDLKPELWIVNASGDQVGSDRQSLNLETWASKCTFSDNTYAYCGVPKSLDEGAGLFPEMADYTSDNLYRIDTVTGQKKLIAIPNGEYNMTSLVISENDRYLYFTDKFTGTIQKIQLK